MAFQPRQTLIEQFSTFLRFENDRVAGWLSDRRLQRSIQKLTKQPDAPDHDAFWVNQWQAVWREHALDAANQTTPHPQQILALAHLSAYIQETCFWSVRRVITKIDSVQFQLVDGFQIAIAELPKLLKAFDPNLVGSFKAYANTAFGNLVRSQLRRRREIDLCSEWGLLLKLSRKQLKETLAHAGLGDTEATYSQLLWQALLEHYRPAQLRSKQAAAPDSATLDLVQQTFAQLCQTASIPAESLSHQQIIQRLQTIAQKARAYLYPSTRSLNATYGDGESELLSNLPDVAAETPMADLIIQEEKVAKKTQQQQLSEVISSAISELEPTSQELLRLYYQEQATQQAIAKKLATKQYTISRKLTRVRQQLLKVVTQWSQTELHISLNSDVIESISNALEEWLQNHYSQPDS